MIQTVSNSIGPLLAVSLDADLRLAIKDLAPKVIDWMCSYQSNVEVETIEYLARQLGALGRQAMSREIDEFDFPFKLIAYDRDGQAVYEMPGFVCTRSEAGRICRTELTHVPRVICTRNPLGEYIAQRIDR